MRFLPNITKIALVAVLLIILGFLLSPYFSGTKPIDPIAFSFGSTSIHWYGITMALAILVATIVSTKIGIPRVRHITEDQFLSASLWMIIGGLIGARLLFVLLKWPLYSSTPLNIIKIGEGGLSLHGALLGGLVALLIYAHSQKLNWWRVADIAVVGIPLGQAIGRLGNFFNQEAFGGATNLPWKMYVAPAFRPEALSKFSYFHPTFAYEALLNLLIFWLMLAILKRYKSAGSLFLIYVAAYSLVRFVMEFFRVDSDHWGVLSIAQWASLGIIIWSIILYYRKIDTNK